MEKTEIVAPQPDITMEKKEAISSLPDTAMDKTEAGLPHAERKMDVALPESAQAELEGSLVDLDRDIQALYRADPMASFTSKEKSNLKEKEVLSLTTPHHDFTQSMADEPKSRKPKRHCRFVRKWKSLCCDASSSHTSSDSVHLSPIRRSSSALANLETTTAVAETEKSDIGTDIDLISGTENILAERKDQDSEALRNLWAFAAMKTKFLSVFDNTKSLNVEDPPNETTLSCLNDTEDKNASSNSIIDKNISSKDNSNKNTPSSDLVNQNTLPNRLKNQKSFHFEPKDINSSTNEPKYQYNLCQDLKNQNISRKELSNQNVSPEDLATKNASSFETKDKNIPSPDLRHQNASSFETQNVNIPSSELIDQCNSSKNLTNHNVSPIHPQNRNCSGKPSTTDHSLCPHWAHCGSNLALFDLQRVAAILRDMHRQREFLLVVDDTSVYRPRVEEWITELIYQMSGGIAGSGSPNRPSPVSSHLSLSDRN
ncbi:hypothetical protein EGW08_007384 [Elysia chlorotica]|uniref:Uncharacterized protein n=1 Tax=Elysia chlorotica TaxID=188477 RepID=A0A3S1A7W6_ELYCH|nr:hypothetical protein EGW08_007384 [Elysia chlorotica]